MEKQDAVEKIAKRFKRLSLAQLMDLNFDLNEEIDLRRQEGEPDTEAEQHRTERTVYTKCGKVGCHCKNGEKVHGPYRYEYWREDGRLRSRYLGKGR